jgi:hypothetical protein
LPELAAVARRMGDSATVLLLTWWGDERKARALLAENGVPLSCAARGDETADLFDLGASPTTFLMRSDGVLVRRIVGPKDRAFFTRELERVSGGADVPAGKGTVSTP